MEVHRGRCGANLTHRARDASEKRTCGNNGFDKPRCREASRPVGPIGPDSVPRALGSFRGGRKRRPKTGVPGASLKNTGDDARLRYFRFSGSLFGGCQFCVSS
jgi:hypothetical protein